MGLVVLLIVLGALMHAARAFVPQGAAPPLAGTTLAFGFLLLFVLHAGKIFARLRLPRLTGYLAAGIVAGPACLDLVTREMVNTLAPVKGVAICLIAFAAGGELNLRRMKPLLRVIGPVRSLAPKPRATCASSRPARAQSTPTRAPRGPVSRATATRRRRSRSLSASIHVMRDDRDGWMWTVSPISATRVSSAIAPRTRRSTVSHATSGRGRPARRAWRTGRRPARSMARSRKLTGSSAQREAASRTERRSRP